MNAKILLSGLMFCAGVVMVSAKDLKVLMVGNSFSICVGKNLPQIVKSVPGHSLELTSTYIGGCALDRHSKNLKKAEENPSFKPYTVNVWTSGAGRKGRGFKASVNELLKKNQYDIITIQQASRFSWKYETYQPYAGELIDYIRKHQPKAEIVIQQTWAYRCDDPQLKPNLPGEWGIDQTGMYEGIRDSYRKLAEAYHFRVIPTGDAVQLFRKYTPVKFQPAAKVPDYPEVPSSAGDVVGASYWRKDAKSGKQILRIDQGHLNSDGEYLQACLWFAFLYGEPVGKIAYVPEGMSKETSALLRKCAQEALDQYKQVK